MMLHVLTVSQDGDVQAESIDDQLFLERLNEQYYGSVTIIDKLPKSPDLQEWGRYAKGEDTVMVIFGGDLLVPEPKTTVTAYAFPEKT